jgi:hypothetical protein
MISSLETQIFKLLQITTLNIWQETNENFKGNRKKQVQFMLMPETSLSRGVLMAVLTKQSKVIEIANG